MDQAPHPLFGSARSFDDCDRSGTPFACLHASVFLSQIDSELEPLETYDLAFDFLKSRRQSGSIEQCRTAVERLILWALLIRRKSIFQLDASDVFEFLWFVQAPPESWLSVHSLQRFVKAIDSDGFETVIPNPKWRPFAAGRLPTEVESLSRIVVSCSALYVYLVKNAASARNPFDEFISRFSSVPEPADTTENELRPSDWDLVLFSAERLALANPKMHERTLFLIAALTHLGVTHSDFFGSDGTVITLQCFVQDAGARVLRLESGDIPVPEVFIQMHLRRFCNFRGLSLETDGEHPLIPRIIGAGQVSRRTLLKIINDAFRESLLQLPADATHGADRERFQSACDAWIAANAMLPRPKPERLEQPEYRDGLVEGGVPLNRQSEANIGPQPLFADFKDILRNGGVVDDHPDTLLYLSLCPQEAMPFEAYELAKKYLYKITSKHTYESYRKFLERLVLWAILVKRKPIHAMVEMDLHDFHEFCKTPPGTWIRTTLQHRFIQVRAGSRNRTIAVTCANTNWRPFWVNVMAGTEQRFAPYHASNETSAGQFSVARSFYKFLLSSGVVETNPLINREAFLFYTNKRRSAPRKRSGMPDVAFKHLVKGCFKRLEGDSLRRALFIIYTVNELQLSWVDVRACREMLTLDCFRAEANGQWVVPLLRQDGATWEVLISDEYIINVLEPYVSFLLNSGFTNIEGYPVFAPLTGRIAITVNRVTTLLNTVCRAAAADMERENQPISLIERVRSLTINNLALARKPSEYLLMQSL